MAKDNTIGPTQAFIGDRDTLQEIARLMETPAPVDKQSSENGPEAVAQLSEEAKEAARILAPLTDALAFCRDGETVYANDSFALALGYSGHGDFMAAGGVNTAIAHALPSKEKSQNGSAPKETVLATTRSGRKVELPARIHVSESGDDGGALKLLELYPSAENGDAVAKAAAALLAADREENTVPDKETSAQESTEQAPEPERKDPPEAASEMPEQDPPVPMEPDERVASVEIRHAAKHSAQNRKKEGKKKQRKNGLASQDMVPSDILAKISHEIRTPLNSIIGFAELMKEERLGSIDNAQYESYVRDIYESGKLTLSLIDDLMNISESRSGGLELNFAATDLQEVVSRAVSDKQTLAQVERVFLRTSVCDGSWNVLADRDALLRVLHILLLGAVRFSPPGGQVIVSLRSKRSGAVRLRVQDSGSSMSKDEIARALDPFAHSDTTPLKRTGNGLGLPLARALVEANHAKFKVKSGPGKGTRIDITFPSDRRGPS